MPRTGTAASEPESRVGPARPPAPGGSRRPRESLRQRRESLETNAAGSMTGGPGMPVPVTVTVLRDLGSTRDSSVKFSHESPAVTRGLEAGDSPASPVTAPARAAAAARAARRNLLGPESP